MEKSSRQGNTSARRGMTNARRQSSRDTSSVEILRRSGRDAHRSWGVPVRSRHDVDRTTASGSEHGDDSRDELSQCSAAVSLAKTMVGDIVACLLSSLSAQLFLLSSHLRVCSAPLGSGLGLFVAPNPFSTASRRFQVLRISLRRPHRQSRRLRRSSRSRLRQICNQACFLEKIV